jgi:hypothetical protein
MKSNPSSLAASGENAHSNAKTGLGGSSTSKDIGPDHSHATAGFPVAQHRTDDIIERRLAPKGAVGFRMADKLEGTFREIIGIAQLASAKESKQEEYARQY